MNDVERLASIRSRHVHSVSIHDAAALIHDAFLEAGGRLEVGYDVFLLEYIGWETSQRNVLARLPGVSQADEMVIVGAHYDSRTTQVWDPFSPAPGANDNASGVAAALELARLIASQSPRRTVLLVAFSGEEIGAYGSLHMVEEILAAGEEVRGVIILDIVGNSVGARGRGAVRAFSSPPQGSASRRLARFVEMQARLAMPEYAVVVESALDRSERYSDHISFSEAGFPAIRLIERTENPDLQHSELDLASTIDPEYLRQVTQLALVSVLHLANGPPPPASIQLANRSGPGLLWSQVEGAQGYVLAFRGEASGQLELLLSVGRETTWTPTGTEPGRLSRVSLAAVDAEGWIGPFSEEISFSP